MKNISNYVNNLNFEYAITYSGLRGKKFHDLKEVNEKEIKRIKKELVSSRYVQTPKLNKQIEALEEEINIYRALIIDKNETFHKSTEKVYKFEKEDKQLQSILEILNTKFEEQTFAMCPPVFRDAIVFYSNEHKIIRILQLCFSCYWIMDENNQDIQVDHKIFPLLKHKLIEVGHIIEEE